MKHLNPELEKLEQRVAPDLIGLPDISIGIGFGTTGTGSDHSSSHSSSSSG